MESASKKLIPGFDGFSAKSFFVVLLLLSFSFSGNARERQNVRSNVRGQAAKASAADVEHDSQGRRVVYKQKNVVDFDAMLLEGDIRNPNEFYFVHRPEEKFGSLVKRRKNFHKEILRDSVMIR